MRKRNSKHDPERYYYEGEIHNSTCEIRENPADYEAYYCRGVAYLNMCKYDKAVSDFNKIIKLNPCHVNAYYDLSVAYFLKKDYIRSWLNADTAREMGCAITYKELESFVKKRR